MRLTFDEVCAIMSALEAVIITSEIIENMNEEEKEMYQHAMSAHRKLFGTLQIKEEFANETN
jgi:hypothetical protein